jgi:hypothetical protein
LDQFLASIPKPLLVVGAIIIGFVLIVANDPPRTVCDGQIDVIRESQEEFLFFRRGAGGATKPALISELFARCRADNSPGGCFELFQRLKKMQADLVVIPGDCSEDAMNVSNIKGGLFGSLQLMAQIAWGESGPSSVLKRNGWLDASDVALFCDLKKSGLRFMGKESFDVWRDSVVSQLPGADLLEGDQPYQRSLFAAPCSEYR